MWHRRYEPRLIRLKNEGKKAFFIGIENGYGIGKDLANIAKFKAIGVNLYHALATPTITIFATHPPYQERMGRFKSVW